jgi:ketosteroid isomerase-like protein
MVHTHWIVNSVRQSINHFARLVTRFLFAAVFLTFIYVGCGVSKSVAQQHAEQLRVNAPRQVTLTTRSRYPQVRLSTYTLICDDDLDRKKAEAEAVMQVKTELPRAVQTKEADRFERILARDFVFHGEDEFYGRADYIRARVNNKDTVMTADYNNVVLHFLGDIAVLTYRNTVVIEPGGPEHTVHMTWADILGKEDGQWKFRAVYLIDSK